MNAAEGDYVEIRGISREPLGKLAVEGWLAWPETRRLADVMGPGQLRFVGGCVRDAIARRPVTDVDAATPLAPEEVMARLEAAGIKVIATGLAHGTVTAVIGARKFEITTLRRDAETDGRHARVEFTDDWIEDAKRRDFTINAMSCSPDGDVYDPFEGMPDLAHGVVRFVGRAGDRVAEDYLRILRFFRFWGGYGRPPADRAALTACRTNAAKLKSLSGERVRDELLKILMVAQPAEAVRLMQAYGVLEQILPEAGEVTRLRLVNWLTTRGVLMEGLAADPLRNLAALLDTDAVGASAVAGRLRLSNVQTDRLVSLVAPAATPTPDQDTLDHEKLLRRIGPEIFRDLAILGWAAEIEAATRLPAQRSAAWRDLLTTAMDWQGRNLPVKGRDLVDMGLAPGPRVGDVLGRVEVWWEDGGFVADREACLAKARDLIGEDK
ncbi:MAG: tRNA nucleotidyltransferase [Rhodospirillaceae bacterium]|nr:tRNA nucleotidyltransferase [Rhodospirillaceae bacterium]